MNPMSENLKAKGHWIFRAFDSNGRLKWTDEVDNLIVNEGLDAILDNAFNASAYTSAHYIGLKGSGAAAAPVSLTM